MRKQTAVAAIVAAISAGALALAMGPLDPPAGPVAPTSPSLAELAALIQAGSPAPTEGPWQVAVIDSRDGLGSQNASLPIAGGAPVLVHSINAHRAAAYVFNGSGTLSGQGTITTGDVVGQCWQIDVGMASGARNSNQCIINVECPNGAEIAWTYDDSAAYFIHVYYKTLN